MSERDAKNHPGMTVREAGRLGGEALKRKYGAQYFRELGRKGGVTTQQRHGDGFYSTIGKLGGQKNASKAESDHDPTSESP